MHNVQLMRTPGLSTKTPLKGELQENRSRLAHRAHQMERTLGRENSYTVGVTTTVGADLGLSYADVFSAGINAEVSYSEEEGTTDTNQQVCGGPWFQEVAGNVWLWGFTCPVERRKFPYTVQFPIMSEGQLSVQNSELCQ
ncbi:MAG: hypothetical protein Q9204_005409, partial [Flavoplaca sp. TL-2023a]